MNQQELIEKLRRLKGDFMDDGFVIDGIFGSYAREDYTPQSDVDILYHLEKEFYTKYSGFKGFKKLDEIKQTIAQHINKNIDLAPKNNLSQTAQKFILKDVIDV